MTATEAIIVVVGIKTAGRLRLAMGAGGFKAIVCRAPVHLSTNQKTIEPIAPKSPF